MHDRELCSLFLTWWKLLSQDSESHVQICYPPICPCWKITLPHSSYHPKEAKNRFSRAEYSLLLCSAAIHLLFVTKGESAENSGKKLVPTCHEREQNLQKKTSLKHSETHGFAITVFARFSLNFILGCAHERIDLNQGEAPPRESTFGRNDLSTLDSTFIIIQLFKKYIRTQANISTSLRQRLHRLSVEWRFSMFQVKTFFFNNRVYICRICSLYIKLNKNSY